MPKLGHMTSPDLMTKREVAEALGLNLSTVNKIVRKGKLKPARTLNGQQRVAMYLFRRTDVERYAATRNERGAA